jgi:hypothetical protein
MPIFEILDEALTAVPETSFGAEGVLERNDLQRLLRENIAVLDDSLMFIAEEFGDWVDSQRRIDLLCIDKSANLVVVELKRTEDGGHMELQSIRYAAMISQMTFDQLVETLARQRSRHEPDLDTARSDILDFLNWEEADEEHFGGDTRIVLASADFGKELTTAVLWLIERGIDIRCVRLKPYRRANGPLLLDIQQIIPLPETASFQTQIGVKRQAERRSQSQRGNLIEKFWEALVARPDAALHAHIQPGQAAWLGRATGIRGIGLNYTIKMQASGAEIYIDRRDDASNINESIFDYLHDRKDQIESDFGSALNWQRLEGKRACRIKAEVVGGYNTSEESWDELQGRMVNAMDRLHAILQPHLPAIAQIIDEDLQ